MKTPILTRLADELKKHPFTDHNLLLQDCAKEIKRLQKLALKHGAPVVHTLGEESGDSGDGGTVDPPAEPPEPPQPPAPPSTEPGDGPPGDQGGT